MSFVVLVVIAVVQGLFVLGLLLLLIASHWLSARASQRCDRDARVAASILRAWLSGQVDSASAVASLDRLRFSALASQLRRSSLQWGGEDWERVAGLIRDTEWFARVRSRAASRIWWRRLHSSRLLSILCSTAELPILHRVIADPHPEVRLAAILSLRRVRDRSLVAQVLDAASSAPPVVQAYLLEVLSECRAELLAVLLQRLERRAGVGEVVSMLRLAGRLGVPALLGQVLPHTGHPDLEVRIAAARALGMYPHPESSATLQALLVDPAWEVRAQAAASLGSIGAVETIEALCRALRDTSWWVRLRAGVSLRLLGAAGLAALREIDPAEDRFAFEMARYVSGLDESAMAEYAGIAAMDFGISDTHAA